MFDKDDDDLHQYSLLNNLQMFAVFQTQERIPKAWLKYTPLEGDDFQLEECDPTPLGLKPTPMALTAAKEAAAITQAKMTTSGKPRKFKQRIYATSKK